ncbi:hypothetical protein H5410_040705 [Solanum commersonii]|uniref:Uncharacterized protein n=1 Tax=Solanum commersonii TaxID=4109 RepID=A0A9J5XRN2_SOLCO|nr:hypothetical protein H5410_040705 [Solanum commersonii]
MVIGAIEPNLFQLARCQTKTHLEELLEDRRRSKLFVCYHQVTKSKRIHLMCYHGVIKLFTFDVYPLLDLGANDFLSHLVFLTSVGDSILVEISFMIVLFL